VDDWIDRTLPDSSVNLTRKGTEERWVPADSNVAHLKMRLVEFICAASGGPQKYQGRDMKSVHQGMKISGGEFDAMLKDLKETLMDLNVGENERKDLFKVMESARKEIVEVP
jgi:hemoglobin